MRIIEDTGNYRVVKMTDRYNGKEKIYYSPQKEVKFLIWKWFKPITFETFDDVWMDSYDTPYKCNTEQEAFDILKRYKCGELTNSRIEEVVYEEVN